MTIRLLPAPVCKIIFDKKITIRLMFKLAANRYIAVLALLPAAGR
jgi:hypothetical protein